MSAASRLGVPENGRQQAEIAAAVFRTYAAILRKDVLALLERPLSMSSVDEFSKRVVATADGLDEEARAWALRADLREANEPERVPLLRDAARDTVERAIDDARRLT